MFKQYANENGGVVQAHVVDENTEGEYQTVDGQKTALVGDVVVQMQNGAYHEIVPADEFNSTYTEASDEDVTQLQADRGDTVNASGMQVQKGFDPNTKTATAVRDYLSRVGSQDEYNRVADAERKGRNRSSAIPERNWE